MAGTWPDAPIPVVDPAKTAGAVARARGAVSGFLTARPGLVIAALIGADAPQPPSWIETVRVRD